MTIINGQGRFGVRTYVAPVSLSSIVTSGLVLNLDAGNAASYPGTGTAWTDLSGNGNNATLYNGAVYNSANGGVMVFDGINDYAKTINNTNITGDANFTISTWVKFLELGGGWRAVAMMGNPNASSGNAIGLMVYGGNLKIVFYQGVLSSISPSISINQWYNLTLTKSSGSNSSSTLKMYINGSLAIIDYPSTSVNLTNTQFYIGSDPANEVSNNINVGNVLLYNKTLSATEVLQNFDATKSRYGFTSYTTRTTAFAAATGITDTTILNALNTFDTGLISNGLDTKMKALYPFVGGTANTHKFNFMDARDSNDAFRLQFNGGWIHSSTGAKPNGTNAYADSYWVPFTQSAIDNVSYNYYSRTNTSGAVNFGSCDSGYANVSNMYISLNGTQNYSKLNGMGYLITSSANSRGLFGSNTTTNGTFTTWKNGSKLGTNTSTPTGLSQVKLWIGAGNFIGAPEYGNMECAFFNMSTGLTDVQQATFYNLVQALQTSLSRQV